MTSQAGKAWRCALLGMLLTAGAGPAAGEPLTCKGDIVSKQGAGLVVRTFRFEVEGVTGDSLDEVLAKCRSIAQQRQNVAARGKAGVPFRKQSDVELECTGGGETVKVRRMISTAP